MPTAPETAGRPGSVLTYDRTTYAAYPSLEGRPVLISGGARGIGASLVAHFVAQRSRVAFLDIHARAADELAAAIEREFGQRPAYRVCDVRDVAATVAAAEAMSRDVGPFEVLVNNAGDDERHTIVEVTPDYWDRQMNVNVRHQFFLAQHLVSRLPEGRRASIINLGSIAWMKGARDIVVYGAAKAAIAGLTKCMAREFGPRRVRVNCIAPGWIITDKQLERARRTNSNDWEAAIAAQAIAEPLEAGDVSRLALWLAADDSLHCSGQTLIIDGGVV